VLDSGCVGQLPSLLLRQFLNQWMSYVTSRLLTSATFQFSPFTVSALMLYAVRSRHRVVHKSKSFRFTINEFPSLKISPLNVFFGFLLQRVHSIPLFAFLLIIFYKSHDLLNVHIYNYRTLIFLCPPHPHFFSKNTFLCHASRTFYFLYHANFTTSNTCSAKSI